MKKTLILLLTAALLSTLISRQAPDEELPPTGTDSATTQETERATEAEGETEPLKETGKAIEPQAEQETEPQTKVQAEQETEPQAKDQTEPAVPPETEYIQEPQETEEDERKMQYCGAGISYGETVDSFLQQKWEEKYGHAGDVELNGQNTQISMVIPILKNSDFELVGISRPEWLYETRWVFNPVGVPQEDVDFYDRILISVFEDPDFFDRAAYVNGAFPDAKAFYNADRWMFDFGDFCCTVFIPFDPENNTGEYPLERVYEYLDFEVVTYSPTAETDAVQ